MNEKYYTISSIANIIQASQDVLAELDPELVHIPAEQDVIASDVQAALSRVMRKGGMTNVN